MMINKVERQIYIILLVFLIMLSLGLGCFIACKLHLIKKHSAQASATFMLKATPIHAEDILIKTSYVGHTEAINQVQIIPYINGYLQQIAVKPGQMVHKGQNLLTIDDAEYTAKFEAADAAVMQAEASLNYNSDYYERVKKSGKRAYSLSDIDNAKNNFLQAKATLMSAKANKKFAEVNLKYTQINAPIDGLIGNFNLSHGDYVTPAQPPLLTIIQTSPIRVVFSLSDAEYFNLKADGTFFDNSTIKLTLPNGKPFKYDGKFQYTDNQINKNTNSLAVYAYFQNDGNELLPNTFVTVNVYHTLKNSVAIDKDKIIISDKGYFINVGRDNKVLHLPVRILAEKDNQYIIQNDFKTGDLLILDNTSNLPSSAEVAFSIVKLS